MEGDEKMTFYARLHALDNLNDDAIIDEGLKTSLEFVQKAHPHRNPCVTLTDSASVNVQQQVSERHAKDHSARHKHTEPASGHPVHASHSSRSAVTVNTIASTVSPKEIFQQRRTRKSFTTARPLQLEHLCASHSRLTPSTIAGGMAGKRKRTTAKLAPEAQRIFNKLVFFFFPNNDINKARRMRISKAVEYGAIWAQNWSDDVTHIIVDRGIQYKELIKYLDIGLSGKIEIVVETYVSDCISYRLVLDPNQSQYRVPGAPNPKTLEPSVVEKSVPESAASLLRGGHAPAEPSAPFTRPASTCIEPVIPGSTNSIVIDTRGSLHLVTSTSARFLANEEHTMAEAGEGEGVSTLISVVHERRYRHDGCMDEERGQGNVRGLEAFGGRLVSSTLSGSTESAGTTRPQSRLDDHAPVGPQDNEYTNEPRYEDELAVAISESRALKGLPIDLEDEDFEDEQRIGDSQSSEENSDEEAQRHGKRSRKDWQENFQCMEKHDGSNTEANPNARTIEILEQMGHYYDRISDNWRAIAYRRAVSMLRKQSRQITTREEALSLPFIGDRLAEKIQEIVWTNKLRRLDNAILDPTDHVLQLFMHVYGVGLSQASRWVSAGFTTLDHLRDHAKLTECQKLGLEHVKDFQTRIPREEVRQLESIVKQTFEDIDTAFQVIVGGSYRRGAGDSGDIDLIITKPNANLECIRTVVLNQLVPALFAKDFLKAALARTNRETGTKWHGACALPGSSVWRRIDLLLVPWDELGAALIYFTGNDVFNRSIRLLASMKGMRLNQRGLYRNVMRGKGRQRITEGELVEGKSERRIFEILGVPWRPPAHRRC